MKEAYILREELTEIFARLYDPKGAKCAIQTTSNIAPVVGMTIEIFTL